MKRKILLKSELSDCRIKAQVIQDTLLDYLRENTIPKFGTWTEWHKIWFYNYFLDKDSPNFVDNDSFYNWLWMGYEKTDDSLFYNLLKTLPTLK